MAARHIRTTPITPPKMAAVLFFLEELPLGLEDSSVDSELLAPFETPVSPEEGAGAEGPLGTLEDVAGDVVNSAGGFGAAVGCGAGGEAGGGAVGGRGGAPGGSAAAASFCTTYGALKSERLCFLVFSCIGPSSSQTSAHKMLA